MLRQAGVASSENSRNGSSVAISPFGDCGGCCFGSICWSFSCSGRVAGVDVDVLCREIARPEHGTAGARAKIDADGDARGGEQEAEVMAVLDAVATADDGDVTDRHRHAAGREGDAGGAGGGEDAAPVRVAAGEGGLDQGGVGDRAGDAVGGGAARGASDLA